MGLVEHFGGFVVTEAREGRDDGFKLGAVAADNGEFGGAVLEDALDDVGEEVFRQFEQAVEIAVGDFRARSSRTR